MHGITRFWRQQRKTPLHFQLRRLRWMVFPVVLLLAAIHQFATFLLAEAFPSSWQWWVQLLAYTLTGSIVSWLGLTWISDAVAKRFETETELRQAYADLENNHQHLLALHNLGEHVANADDQHAILEIAARAPLELTTAQASSVVTFNEAQDRLKLDITWGLSDNYLKILQSQLEKGIPAGRCQECSSLKTHIGSDCPLFQGLQTTAASEGIHSLVCLPVTHDDERVGIISAYFPSADGPPEDQVRLLNILGGVIATALENLRARARELETVHALDRATNGSNLTNEDVDLDLMATQILEIAVSGWDAQVGALLLWQTETQTWDCLASQGFMSDSENIHLAFATMMAKQAYESNHTVIQSGLDKETSSGLGSIAAAPLTTEGKTLGVLFLGAQRRRAINPDQMELLNTVAHQIALAIRNAQLYSQLGQMAVLKERYRLSREFHDGLAQTLSYLGFQAERVENLVIDDQRDDAVVEINELRQTIRAAYIDVREAIDGLRLSLEDPGQITARLQAYINAFSRQTGITTNFLSSQPAFEISPEIGLQILRIAQEALTNVRKHAGANQVDVRLQAEHNLLQLTIEDNGRGFPLELETDRLHHSYGLSTMRERAEELGGSLTIATNPNQGTRVSVEIPVPELIIPTVDRITS